MHAFPTLVSLASLASLVHASIYVTNPVQSTICTGGQSCQVNWVDNGQSPLLADIGECQVALYTGELVQVQSLPSVDVATTSSFSFVPDSSAGPNGQYYLVFTANSISYEGFSATFTLDGMSGTTPGGGSSAPTSVPATTSAGSSTSPGSSAPATSPSGTTTLSTVSAPSGTSSPAVSTITPTSSTSAVDTATATATTTPTVTTPTASITTGSGTFTSPSTTATFQTSTTASASASATNAAVRAGSSTSLGSVAALLVLSGVLAF